MSYTGLIFESLYAEPSRNGVYKPAQFRGHGVRMVNMGELFGHEFIGAQEMERIELSDSEMQRAALEDGDLLFGRRSLVEAGAGKCALVVEPPEPITFESSIIRVRLRRDKANPRFFHYYFASPQGRGRVRTIVSGATVKGIRGSDLAKLEVDAPPLRVQNRIVQVLRTYDDLVENNRRRMELLDEAVRQLYREWFVRLRFPGHEHARITDRVPDAWQRRTLESCATFRSGGTPNKGRTEYWEGDIPWVSSGEMAEKRIYDTRLHVSREGAEAGSRLVSSGTILIVVRGMSLAKEFRLATVAREMAFNQDLKALEVKEGVGSLFLFQSLFEQRDRIRDLATEASHGTKKLDTAVLERLPILVAEPRLQRLFQDTIASTLAQCDNLFHQNVRLRTARDLLLPRLMSGEITV